MRRTVVIASVSLMLSSCTLTNAHHTKSSNTCRITGKIFNWKSSHPKLTKRLCAMSRALGPVEVTSSCRTRKRNKSVKNSYHLYARGCKAADVKIKGVSRRRILNYWKKSGGGTGYYCGRSFVHVDVGPTRSWTWYCG